MIDKMLTSNPDPYRLLQPITCLKTIPMQTAGFCENKSPVTPVTPAKLLARYIRKG
jgi:hypothetical protein